ncbi:MAG: T9SS type A sorting domain-containing protein [Flavobacteriales bacterium]|nr:T9SS type A sorting domain-containing protein [Flavobacteriales bacterium]
MNKLYLLLTAFLISITTHAQLSILFSENFEDNSQLDYIYEDIPPGILNDQYAYIYDEDQLPDGSPSSRPGVWFLAYGFADVDSNSVVFASNSWTNNGSTPVKNWFILPAIQITDGATAVLRWKSAPYQTPYYLDGYKVLISTTTNAIDAFTDTVFVAAEYISGASSLGGNYAAYTFSPGFVHGLDGTYIQHNPNGDGDISTPSAGDTARNIGILREFNVSLSNYDNQKIYIAFLHHSIDDNLLSIDDIVVEEVTDIYFSVEDQQSGFAVSMYPNPANQFVNIAYDANTISSLTVEIMDQAGKILLTKNTTPFTQIQTDGLASGVYLVRFTGMQGSVVKKLIVQH